jgi:hypothetical protein
MMQFKYITRRTWVVGVTSKAPLQLMAPSYQAQENFQFFLQHQQPATHIGIVKVIIKLAKVMRLAKQEKHESSVQSTTTILHTFPNTLISRHQNYVI